MRLILLRHGIAIDRDHPDCPDDPDRFLTEIGIEKTRVACRGLRAIGIEPDAVISSPYVRAHQTAQIAVSELRFRGEIEIDDSLMWMKPPTRIMNSLQDREEGPLLLVGHAPHLDELIAFLCGAKRAFTSMKKAAAVEIECLERSAGGGYLVSHMPPKTLRLLAETA